MRKLLTEEDKARIRASELRLAQLAESVKATQDANKAHDDSVYGSKEIAYPVGESKPLVPDNGPAIVSERATVRYEKGGEKVVLVYSPQATLRDTRGIRVRTTASKLGDARLGAARHGIEHSQTSRDYITGGTTQQAIAYDPSRDYVNAEGAFVALRDRDVKALPPKLRRAYERAKHRASVANNVRPE